MVRFSLIKEQPDMTFEFKGETDLYLLNQIKTICLTLTISKDGKYFGMYCRDRNYRVFNFKSGKLYKTYNESLKFYVENYHNILKNDTTRLEKHDFDKRLLNEKEIEKLVEKHYDIFPNMNLQFDETGHFIYYTTILGIKMIELHTDKLVRILGKNENAERFLLINLFQGKSQRVFIFLLLEQFWYNWLRWF
jgi:peptidylprolyl isomerase domain and WD repeat-containing protein 1